VRVADRGRLELALSNQQVRLVTRARIAGILIGLLATTVAVAAGQMCFKTGEHTEGDKKVCIYQCRMKQVKVTINANQTCPSSIKN